MARPDCPKCEGTGFVVDDEEARLTTALRCECGVREPGEADLSATGLPQRYRHCTLAAYRPRTPRQEQALKIAENYVHDYPNNDKGLLFTGPCGVGKTHLASSVLRELVLEQAVDAVFADYQDLLKRIQMTYSRGAEGLTEEQVLGPVLEAELLVLDDLGARRPTPWAEEVVSHLLSVRYNEERATILTTNLADLEAETRPGTGAGGAALAERVSERVMSRLHEMCSFLTLDGPDYRRDRAGSR